MSEKTKFSTTAGLIAATVGSAVGLGNIWRFPAETQANGGAAFLFIYIICIFLFGIPVMTSEFALGRGGNADAIGAFRNVTPGKKWWMVGAGAIFASYIILSFYMVVSGWTLEYLWQSITGYLYEPIATATSLTGNEATQAQFSTRMTEFIATDTRPLILTYIMLFANLGVLLLGVKKGIEKISNILMPLLFILLIIFCAVAISLPGASAGIEFFLKPDFSKVTATTFIRAIGQTFFSLSLGMGILITYASYYPKTIKLTRTALTVSMLDLLVAFLMGIIIFPGVMTFGLADHQLAGSALVFVTLPEIFAQMPLTQLWSTLFFLLLTVAAFTSTISLGEVAIAFLQGHFKITRTKACFIVIMPLFILSAICSLSIGTWSHITIAGRTIFDFLDYTTTNIMLPICSILVCVYMGWVAPKKFFRNELTNNGTIKSYAFEAIHFIVKWIAPVLIAWILISSLI